MSEMLSKDYVLELLKGCFSSNKILEICATHLKFEYLQTEAQKKIVKYVFDSYYVNNTSPTIGMVGQAFIANKEVIALLSKIKTIDIKGKDEQIINGFETFIKDVRFQVVIKKVAELYNANKQEEAVKTLAKESQEIAEFTLRSKYYVKVFEQFDERVQKRQVIAANDAAASKKEKLTTGIHQFDQITYGGYKKGTSFLAMARSGVGKSTYLRWTALCNARLGKKVVFFQAEDTEENALEAFDAAWTSITSNEIEEGYVPLDLMKGIDQVKKEIKARGGEIILIASEQFDKLTIEECRDKVSDLIKLEGNVDMILFDYLEIFSAKGHTSKGDSAERRRREDIANKMTSLATEFNVVVGTATQSADIEMEKINNPDFVMTRHHASEFKNIIKPFSYFFTFNATSEEYDQQILRIHVDKLRKHHANQTIKIYQSRQNGRFYDAVKTKQYFQ